MNRTPAASVIALSFLWLVPTAHADIYQTYDLIWSGASAGNNAIATGQITLDLTTLPNPSTSPFPFDNIYSSVQSLTVTVTGANSGNGTWTKADLAPIDWWDGEFWTEGGVFWWTGGGALDMGRELIGQPTVDGSPWGEDISVQPDGEFNLVFSDPSAPRAMSYFTMGTSGANDPSTDVINLTEFAPVPEPTTLAFFITGLLGLGLVRRGRTS